MRGERQRERGSLREERVGDGNGDGERRGKEGGEEGRKKEGRGKGRGMRRGREERTEGARRRGRREASTWLLVGNCWTEPRGNANTNRKQSPGSSHGDRIISSDDMTLTTPVTDFPILPQETWM